MKKLLLCLALAGSMSVQAGSIIDLSSMEIGEIEYAKQSIVNDVDGTAFEYSFEIEADLLAQRDNMRSFEAELKADMSKYLTIKQFCFEEGVPANGIYYQGPGMNKPIFIVPNDCEIVDKFIYQTRKALYIQQERIEQTDQLVFEYGKKVN